MNRQQPNSRNENPKYFLEQNKFFKNIKLLLCGISFSLGNFMLAAEPLIKVEPAEIVIVKGEKTRMPGEKIAKFSGGINLREIQVMGKGRGVSAYGALMPDSVTVRSQGRTLVLGKDYIVDYDWGKIGLGHNSSVKVGDVIEIDYSYNKRRIDSLIYDVDGKQIVIKGDSHLNVPEPPRLTLGQQRISNIFVDYRCDGTNAVIFPIKESSREAKTATTSGMIPQTMAKIKTGKPVKIVCWGDSVTAGKDLTPGTAYTDIFRQMLKKKFPNATIKLKVVAVGGSNSRQWLYPKKYPYHECNWENVAKEQPDLITIEFVNDSWMGKKDTFRFYGEILERIKAISIETEVILITPHFTMKEMMKFKSLKEKEKRPYVLALRQFCKENNIGLADASARWEHLAAEGIPYTTLLINSINHPNTIGHRMFAEELIKNFE